MELTGTSEERIAAAVEFARAHGGFEHCRLYSIMYINIAVRRSE